MKKIIAFLLVVSLTATIAIGGTLAYFTDRDSEANVFTVGNVEIDLNEKFDQGATLIPGVNIEKKPTITNTGINDAWVWLEFAIPSALDNYVEGTEQGSNENVIHWNPKGATTEGYVTDARVQAAIDAGFFGDMDTTNLTADYINTNKMHWNVFNSIDTGKNVYQKEIDGVLYNVYVLLYNKALTPGETTLPNIEKVFLDARVDIDPDGNWNFVENGVATPISWNSETNGDPIIYVSAYAMQKENFATVNEAYAAYQKQWGDNGGEYADPVDPDATLVDTFEKLQAAVAEGGSIALAADIEVTSNLTVSKDVVLYAKSGAELSFAPAAQMNVKDGATLELKGVTVDNGDTFSFGADGKLAIADLAGRKTNAAFAVAAGSKLIVGEGTEITNIVSNGNAAITASGTADNRATVIVKGTISDCAGKSGTVIDATSNADVYIEDGAVIKGNVSYNDSNHGIIKVYSGSLLTINGGEIGNNKYAGNGVIGIYNASVVMNGGKISGNEYIGFENGTVDPDDVQNNGRGGIIYVHKNSKFTMNGGEISGNTVGISSANGCGGAIDTLRGDHVGVTVTINGGTVKNNTTPSDADYFGTTPGMDYFGSADSAAHISVSAEADVSGMIRIYNPEIEVEAWVPSYVDINTIG